MRGATRNPDERALHGAACPAPSPCPRQGREWNRSTPGVHILFTNNTLDDHAGTEVYTRDVALGLQTRGRRATAFTLEPGRVAEEMRASGIPVFNDFRRIPAEARPDLIHGHHFVETTLAALAFPDVPVVSFCHGPVAWQEAPCRMPNVAGWVAVDEACCRRLVDVEGIPADRVEVVSNFVDTGRFRRRESPLPDRPTRALVFSNTMADCAALRAVEEACAARGIALDVVGLKAGTATETPEDLLPRYDLVFAKAKAAIEAMASGSAVVLIDYFGAGEMVTTGAFDRLRRFNFGFATMDAEPTAEHVGAQIDRFDRADAAAVADRIREEASLHAALDRIDSIHQQAASFEVPAFDPIDAAADFLRLQALLAKQFLSAMKPAFREPLVLPPPPLPAEGNLRVFLEAFLARHQGPQDRLAESRGKVGALRASLERERSKKRHLAARVKELESQHRARRAAGRGWWRRLFSAR